MGRTRKTSLTEGPPRRRARPRPRSPRTPAGTRAGRGPAPPGRRGPAHAPRRRPRAAPHRWALQAAVAPSPGRVTLLRQGGGHLGHADAAPDLLAPACARHAAGGPAVEHDLAAFGRNDAVLHLEAHK